MIYYQTLWMIILTRSVLNGKWFRSVVGEGLHQAPLTYLCLFDQCPRWWYYEEGIRGLVFDEDTASTYDESAKPSRIHRRQFLMKAVVMYHQTKMKVDEYISSRPPWHQPHSNGLLIKDVLVSPQLCQNQTTMLHSANIISPEATSEPSIVIQEKQHSVSLPSNLAQKILWNPPFKDPSPLEDKAGIPVPQVSLKFPNEILSEVQAATSYVFSRSVQMATLNMHDSLSTSNQQSTESLPEPIISLYYPQSGCHDVIDSMVKLLAQQEQADIVVLDSLELALGEFGGFGKGEFSLDRIPCWQRPVSDAEHTMHSLYKTLRSSNDPQADTVQKMFNDIVNIQRGSTTASCDSDVTAGEQSPRSRIVYMRDFGTIAPSAKPFLPHLLQALRIRRSGQADGKVYGYHAPIHPTILILGYAESPSAPCDNDSDDSNNEFSFLPRYLPRRSHKSKSHPKPNFHEFTQGGAALDRILPSLDNIEYILEAGNLPRLSPISAAFFLTSLVDAGKLQKKHPRKDSDSTPESESAPAMDLSSLAVKFGIFPVDSHADEFRQVEKDMACRRRQDVQNAWMVRCLGGKAGASPLRSIQSPVEGDQCTTKLPDTSKSSALLDELSQHTGILLPVALDHIAKIALGLASSQDSGYPAGVSPSTISRAYQLFMENWKTRCDWLKTIKESEEESRKRENTVKEKAEEKVDPIIKQLKDSNDLNSYEKKLLSCVVNSGWCNPQSWK